MIEYLHSLKNDPKRVIEEVEEGIKRLGFEPTLAIFFLTPPLQKNCERFNLEGIDTLTVPVEGYLTPEAVWTRGCLCMLADVEHSVQTFKGNASEVVEQLRRARKGKFNLLVYPLLYVGGRLDFLRKYFSLKRTSDLDKANQVFEEIIYPMNSMLRPFRDEGKKAVSLNIYPVKLKPGEPQITLNGEKLGRAVVNVAFNKDFECKYTDFMPERGRSYEETKEILKQEMQFIKEVKVEKKRLAISSIDGLSVRDFMRQLGIYIKESFEKDVEGEIFGSTPYGLHFFSKETNGSAGLGLVDYDLTFYPSLFELSKFLPEGIVLGEKIAGGISRILNELHSCDFILLDQNIVLMYEEKVLKISDTLKTYGIITSFPSVTCKQMTRQISEIENKIFVNTTLSTVMLSHQ